VPPTDDEDEGDEMGPSYPAVEELSVFKHAATGLTVLYHPPRTASSTSMTQLKGARPVRA